eukprot:1357621-Amorphochlora_amoeboformis.AAC.2
MTISNLALSPGFRGFRQKGDIALRTLASWTRVEWRPVETNISEDTEAEGSDYRTRISRAWIAENIILEGISSSHFFGNEQMVKRHLGRDKCVYIGRKAFYEVPEAYFRGVLKGQGFRRFWIIEILNE